MKEPNDALYLQHIRDAIAQIGDYLVDVDEPTFRESKLLQDGLIRQLQIIGEAARRLSPSLRALYPDVPWQDIIGMRHKLVHDYFGIDLAAVWTAAVDDIPNLKQAIQRILDELSSE